MWKITNQETFFNKKRKPVTEDVKLVEDKYTGEHYFTFSRKFWETTKVGDKVRVEIELTRIQ